MRCPSIQPSALQMYYISNVFGVTCNSIIIPMKINYFAVVACVLMHMVLGGIWFSAVFGNAWMEYNHIAPGSEMAGGPMPYLYSIFMAIMMAFLVSWLSGRMNIRNALDGARAGFFIGFSTFLVGFATNYRYSGRPMKLALIDALYPVLSLTIMGAIIGGWKTKAQKIAQMQRA